MTTTLPDLTGLLGECRQAAAFLMESPLAAPDWAAEAAEALLNLTPSLRLVLCRRLDGGPSRTAVRARGVRTPDASAAVRAEIRRLANADGAPHPSQALGVLFGLRCSAAVVRDGDRPWAFLAVGAVEDAPAESHNVAEASLALYADSLAAALRMKEEARRRQAAERERDEFAAFALAGQATTALAHELNNLLNNVVLQTSVLQLQLEEKHRPALDVIRRQAVQATGLLRPLGQASGERAKGFYTVDLSAAVAELMREDAPLAARVRFEPAAGDEATVRGTTAAVKQLVRLLLSGATGDSSPSEAAVEKVDDRVQFMIDASFSSEQDGKTPEMTLDGVLWNRLGDVERLAAQSLLRQLGGELRLAPRPDGGFSLRLSL